MENKFYTSVILDGSNILYRGVLNGKRIKGSIKYKPKLYIKTSEPTKWKTLDGFYVEEKSFNSIWDAYTFIKKYKEIQNFKIYGNQRWEYAFISDAFPKEINYNPEKIITATIDIEVDSSDGFPLPERADKKITAITMHVFGKYIVFGLKDFDISKIENIKNIDVKYYKCYDEIDLIKQFLDIWTSIEPDIITGWNINMFDIPYLINRITKLLGAQEASRISPWNKINLREQRIGKKIYQMYDIIGISILDYIDLYKKFAPQPNQESYSLEYISTIELNKHKLDYHTMGYKNLHDLRIQNHQIFIEYNIIDVNRVIEIEEKLKLIELSMTLAYMNKVNIGDVFSQGRMWDCIIFNKLKERNIVVPPIEENTKWRPYEGAYVKEPSSGWYNWLASFDLTSLYPHLIMMYNLSPETIVEPKDYDEEIKTWMSNNSNKINVENLLNETLDLNWLKTKQLTLTPNGQLFHINQKGFLGEIMETMFNERAIYKKMELDAKKKAEKTNNVIEKKKLKDSAERFKAIQMALKICLNSAYGSIGNRYFRYFDIRIAEAVTLTGQLSIRWIQKKINEYFNKILKTNDDYVIASDTDSIYLHLEKIIQKLTPESTDTKNIINVMDKLCEQKIKPFIDKSYNELSNYINSYAQKMVMKREVLADQGIWLGKKNYILSVYDNEGVVYTEPDIKIIGWAAVRTDRPKYSRDKLKEAVKLILSKKDKEALRKFVEDFRIEFYKQPLIKIASPTGITELSKYENNKTIWGKGTPMHVKGALVYNYYINSMNLGKKYEQINAKDKIKYLCLKNPNPFHSNVIGFLDEVPEEFDLNNYIDYEAQFNKVFIEPLKIVTNVINWDLENTASLEEFFV